MKKEFIGYYDPTHEEVEKAWSEGRFVFDANVLLNLYRYSKPTCLDLISVIEKLKDKLFMPHQVGLEFHSNRLGVIEAVDESFSTLVSKIETIFRDNVILVLNQYKRHPSIQLKSLEKLNSEYLKTIKEELIRQEKLHTYIKNNDEILKKLSVLYENKVGKEFPKDELKKIYLEGKERYEQKIPPGYKDEDPKKKKGERSIYGDLIIWKEIIAECKKNKTPFILVTDDRKEDWWKMEDGKTIRPREELIKEFFDNTGVRILIYNADSFLKYARERKIVKGIKDASIDEVHDVRKSDEAKISMLDNLISSGITWAATTPTLNDYFQSHSPNGLISGLSGIGDIILFGGHGSDGPSLIGNTGSFWNAFQHTGVGHPTNTANLLGSLGSPGADKYISVNPSSLADFNTGIGKPNSTEELITHSHGPTRINTEIKNNSKTEAPVTLDKKPVKKTSENNKKTEHKKPSNVSKKANKNMPAAKPKKSIPPIKESK